MLGFNCRIHSGDDVFKQKLPIVIDEVRGRNLGKAAENKVVLEPWEFFVFPGFRVHHGTCGLEQQYLLKIARRILHKVVPKLQMFIWGDVPKPRPGEEQVYSV